MVFLNTKKKEMINRAKTYLYAIYGKRCVDGFLNRYGSDILFHRSVTDESKHRVYGYPIAENMILSKYHMHDMVDMAVQNINDLLLTSVETQRTVNQPRPISIYTWLVSGADSRPVTPAGTLRWTDKRNDRDTYGEYQSLLTTVTRQLRENQSLDDTTFLASDIENPWHSRKTNVNSSTVRDIYSHAHTHGLVATTDPNEARTLERVLRSDFVKTTGYRPSYCNVRPLRDRDRQYLVKHDIRDDVASIARFVRYLYRDYHIQTKDCDDFSQLPSQVQHVIIMAQLNSTKRKRCQRYVHIHQPMTVSQDDVRANPTVASDLVAGDILAEIVHQESTNRENGNRDISPIVVDDRHISVLFNRTMTEPASGGADLDRDQDRSPVNGADKLAPIPASNSPPLQARDVVTE